MRKFVLWCCPVVAMAGGLLSGIYWLRNIHHLPWIYHIVFPCLVFGAFALAVWMVKTILEEG